MIKKLVNEIFHISVLRVTLKTILGIIHKVLVFYKYLCNLVFFPIFFNS